MRHLKKIHIDEIIMLLNEAQKQSMVVVMHYPNDDNVNIFHMQLYPKDYSSEDLVGLQTEISITRGYLLDKYLNISDNYFMDRDIVLTFKINAKYGLNKSELRGTESYDKIKQKHKKTRPELYPEDDKSPV